MNLNIGGPYKIINSYIVITYDRIVQVSILIGQFDRRVILMRLLYYITVSIVTAHSQGLGEQKMHEI